MLADIGIARPEQQRERLAGVLEVRQHDARRRLHLPHFLLDVGHIGLGRGGRDERRFHLAREPGRQTQPAFVPGGIVNDQRLAAVTGRGGILDAGRAFLADDGGVEPLRPRRRDQRGLAEIVAAELLVHLVQHHVFFQEADRRALQADHRLRRPQRVAEIAGVADVMPGRDGGRIHRGHGGIQRMRIGEVHALGLHPGEVGHVARLHAAIAQPVRHEDDDVALGLCGRLRQCGQAPCEKRSQRQHQAGNGGEFHVRFPLEPLR